MGIERAEAIRQPAESVDECDTKEHSALPRATSLKGEAEFPPGVQYYSSKNMIKISGKNKIYVFALFVFILVIGFVFCLYQKKDTKQPIAETSIQKIENEYAVEIDGATYKIMMPENSTAYDLMSALKDNGKLTFSEKEYAGMGKFIEEINGIKNDVGKNTFWLYYINNAPAQAGISNYVLKPGDIITWKYEEAKF